jgi:hypothetical protein
LRQRRRAATIHNIISTPRTPTPPPLPVNAGGRPSTGTRGGEATSAAVAVRLRTHARRPKRRGGESRTSAAIVDRRTSSLASRYGLRIFCTRPTSCFHLSADGQQTCCLLTFSRQNQKNEQIISRQTTTNKLTCGTL